MSITNFIKMIFFPLRKYRFLLLIFFLLVWKNGEAQEMDSLWEMETERLLDQIKRVRQDTAKAGLYNRLSDRWADVNDSLAIAYARQSLDLSEGDAFYTGSAYFYLGGAYYSFQEEKSKEAYLKAINFLKSDPSKKALSLQSRAWHNYGALLQREGDEKAYIDILLNYCIPLAEAAEDSTRMAEDLANVGMVFGNIQEYEKATSYYREAIELAEQMNVKPINLPSYYTNLGKIHLFNQQDKLAKAALDQSRTILEGAPPSYRNAEYALAMGIYQTHQGQWDAALQTLERGRALTDSLKLDFVDLEISYQRYKTLNAAKRFEAAKMILQELKQNPLVNLHPQNKKMVLFNLAEIDYETGNPSEAYDWLLQYVQVADSMNKAQLNEKIAEMELNYQSEKKQREILFLQNQNNQQELVLQKRHFQIYALIGGLALFLMLSIITYVLYLNKRQKVLQQKHNHDQALERLKKDQRLKTYRAMLRGQEQERQRVARELHDAVGGILSGLKLKLSDLFQSNGSKKNPAAHRIMDQLDQSLEEVRRISRNMMPETLIRFGLGTALKELCEALQTQSLSVEFQSFGLGPSLQKSVQLTIYRVVQELLTNAVRHGKPSFILVQCSQNENRIFITVEDDGEGFCPNTVESREGVGMKNIQNRVDYLNGRIAIDSSPGEGTTVNIELHADET